MSKTKAVRYLLFVFIGLVALKAIGLSFIDLGKQQEATLQAYPVKPYDELFRKHSELATRMGTVGQPVDHAKDLIESDLWTGSAKLFVKDHSRSNDPDIQNQCRILQMKIDGIVALQNDATKFYMAKYPSGNYDAKYVELLTAHRNWQNSVQAKQEWGANTKQAWAMLLVHSLWCALVIMLTMLLEQGVLWPVAMRYSAYATVALFTFGGGAVGLNSMLQAQTLVPTTNAKLKKDNKSKDNKDKDDQGTENHSRFKLNYAAVEFLASPQAGGGQIQIAPEMAADLFSVHGAKFSTFSFIEFRKSSDLMFGQMGLDVSHPKWHGARFTNSAGISGRKFHASIGAGIALKETPLRKFMPTVDYLNANYYHGFGAAARNEVQLVGSTVPIDLGHKLQLVGTGFYRIRDLDSISRNYGQLQLQLKHTRLGRTAIVYEAEVIGRSINHQFGLKLFLR